MEDSGSSGLHICESIPIINRVCVCTHARVQSYSFCFPENPNTEFHCKGALWNLVGDRKLYLDYDSGHMVHPFVNTH